MKRKQAWLSTTFLFALTLTAAVAADWWTPAARSAASDLDRVFGGQADSWKVLSGQYEVKPDATLGGDVLSVATNAALSLEGQTQYSGAHEIRARLRLNDSTTTFWFGLTNATDAGFVVNLAANKAQNVVSATVYNRGRPFQDDIAALAEKIGWSPAWNSSFSYYLRAYPRILPGWEENFRAQVEDAMARLPGVDTKWIDLRIQFRKGFIQVWLDDRAVVTKSDPALDPQGRLKLNLPAGIQMASFAVVPFEELADFHPIALGGYANARAFLGQAAVDEKSLPPPDQVASVEGIPFRFPGVNPEGNDHLDIGQSLLRQANMIGYVPSWPGENARWHGASMRDPARIQIRIPNGRYDNLYLVAASDGDDNSVPIISAMFYRPQAGFVESFETRVPLATARSTEAKPLPVTLTSGKKVNLWLVKLPLDPSRLTAFTDMDIIEVELTKKVHQYRSYPDPISYGWHQGGLPSGVHVYAATLSRAPIVFEWQPDRFGHVWTSPEVAAYTATVTNRTTAEVTGKVYVTTRSHDGTEETKQEQAIKVPAGGMAQTKFSIPVKLNGYHDITATLDAGSLKWAEKRSFVQLAPDTRTAKWTEGKGALFGYWSYGGGHHTPSLEHHLRLMMLAGARTSLGYPGQTNATINALMEKHWSGTQPATWIVSPQDWAVKEPFDPAKVAEFQKDIIEKFKTQREAIPAAHRPDHVYFYTEPHITARLTAGNVQEYLTGEPLEYTEHEKERIAVFKNTAKLAAEAVRRDLPGLKVMIPWGDPGCSWPILRAGYPKELIDGSGLDVPGFERIPERQLHEQSIHRMYAVRKEYAAAGIPKPRLQYCEGIFVPTEPGAVSWREQMDIYTRWNLINMAYGVDRYHSGWFAFDCGNYYGAEHYGGCGIQRRIPYCDPKPAYASYATMTDKLNEANFDGWVPTGSLTTFCLRFKHETRGFIYALWTLRGKRPVTLMLAADAKAAVTDSMNNTKEIASDGKKLTVTTDQSVIYVTAAGEITAAAVGAPDNSDSMPAPDARQVANLGDGSWQYTSHRDEVYEKNHWGIFPRPGKFSSSISEDALKGKVLNSKLEKQEKERPFMPWYNTLTPAKPIKLDGAPAQLGIWVKGASDWGRFIYVLRDAKGERWISIGTKDDYNCDDVHSWSSFNFDGWRYLRFELPGHEGWDNFRKIGTTWWGSSAKAVSSPTGKPLGDDIVDLPLSLEEIIVEQRSHVMYVNDPQPAASDTVSFGTLHVEYATPHDSSKEAVRLSKLRMPLPKENPNLPNPIADLTRNGVGAPTKIVKLAPPEHYYDGTRMHVHFSEVPGAKAYSLWVGPHADGRNAVNLAPTLTNGQLVAGLRPAVKLYYWVTYTDANDKVSKPSPVHEEVTVDNFKEK